MDELNRLGAGSREDEETARLVAGFAHPLRLQILASLASGRKSAVMLSAHARCTRTEVMEQLDHLVGLGLIGRMLERDVMWYRLVCEEVRTVLHGLEMVLGERPC